MSSNVQLRWALVWPESISQKRYPLRSKTIVNLSLFFKFSKPRHFLCTGTGQKFGVSPKKNKNQTQLRWGVYLNHSIKLLTGRPMKRCPHSFVAFGRENESIHSQSRKMFCAAVRVISRTLLEFSELYHDWKSVL